MCGLSNMLDRPLRNGFSINYCEHNAKHTTGQLVKKYNATPLTELECSLTRSLPDTIPTSMTTVQQLKDLSRCNSLLTFSKMPFPLRFSEKKIKHSMNYYFPCACYVSHPSWMTLLQSPRPNTKLVKGRTAIHEAPLCVNFSSLLLLPF